MWALSERLELVHQPDAIPPTAVVVSSSVHVDGVEVIVCQSQIEAILTWGVVLFMLSLKYQAAKHTAKIIAAYVLAVEEDKSLPLKVREVIRKLRGRSDGQ